MASRILLRVSGRFALVAILWCSLCASAVASSGSLREIGHVLATENACGNVVVHANSAIAATLRDDEQLRRAVVRLRSNDFEETEPIRHGAMTDIARIGGTVQQSSGQGASEVKRLDALAGSAPGAHAQDLRLFADALGSALARQAKMAGDLSALLAALDFRELEDAPAGVSGYGGRTGSVVFPTAPLPIYRTPATPAAMARAKASDIEAHLAEVALDETRAAERVDAAVTGC